MKIVALLSCPGLSGDNPRGKEEQQLLRSNTYVVAFEKVSDKREAAEQRYLSGGKVLRGYNNASHDDCAAIRHENFRLFPGFCGGLGLCSTSLARELACLKTKPAF